MSIRLRVVLVVLALFIVAGAAVLYTTQEVYQTAIDRAANDSLSVASESFDNLEAQDTEKLSAALDVMMTREDLQQLFVAKDREGLYAAAAPLFEGLRERYAITHWYFIEKEPVSTVFLRVHSKDKYDDEVKRDTFLTAVDTKSYGAGKDLGKTAFALRVVHPWYNAEGELIGYMEVGQEIEKFLEIMSGQSGDSLALVLKKDAVDEAEWAVMRENAGLENNWNEHDSLVVAATTEGAVDPSDIAGLKVDSLSDDGELLGTSEDGDQSSTIGAFPVKNTRGVIVGAVVVGHDTTALVTEMGRARTTTMAILGAVGVLLIGIVILMLNTLVFNRLTRMITHMETVSTRLAGGDFDVEMPEASGKDEIGHFEEFFGKFLKLVASAMKQRKAS